MRARQTVAPRSISACAAAAVNAWPRALLHAADVHVDRQHVAAEREAGDGVGGVAPDAGQLRQILGPAVRGDVLRRAVQAERAPVVAEPLPLADHVGGRRRRERLDSRPALEPPLPRGTTRSTCVCCAITSLTRIAYGSRVSRQGRCREFWLYQRARAESTGTKLEAVAAGRVAMRGWKITAQTVLRTLECLELSRPSNTCSLCASRRGTPPSWSSSEG